MLFRPTFRVYLLRGATLALLAAGLATPAGSAPGAGDAAVLLQPHRIAYEVSLGAKTGGNAFTSAQGVIALEFTGNACAGFATNFRQATTLADADGETRKLDFRVKLWEEGAGKRFRFNVVNEIGQTMRNAEGEARRVSDGSVSVAKNRPKGKKGDFDGAISFPSAMMIDLLRSALKGERRFDARLFGGRAHQRRGLYPGRAARVRRLGGRRTGAAGRGGRGRRKEGRISAQALVLDFGGVISRMMFETHELSVQALGLPPGTLTWKGPFDPATDPLWQGMQADQLSERDYWMARTREVARLLGEDWDKMETFVQRARGADVEAVIRPEAVTLICAAKAAGKKLAILSNELDLFYGADFQRKE